MAASCPAYHHKKTRLNLESTAPGYTVIIRLPPPGRPSWSAKSQKRSSVAELPVAEDENTFRHRHLATAGSIYHRTYHKSPSSFLWRILEDGNVLALRAVDISKQPDLADANLNLRFVFPSAIKQDCIAFADPTEHDVLNVFVLLESNYLYTLTLRPDDFRKPTSTEARGGDLSKSYISSTFSIKHPHRMVALNARVLLISLHDGGLLQLRGDAGGDGLHWKEVLYNEGGWGQGLRSLIPFKGNNSIRHGNINLDYSVIISMAASMVSLNHYDYAFTVTLDHRIRVWNLTAGRVAYTSDLLNHEVNPNNQARQLIRPSHSHLVKVLGNGKGDNLCVTFSPLGPGQFKFWQIFPAEEGDLELVDLFPNVMLEPHASTADVWSFADFSVLLDEMKTDSYNVWVLWKNNTAWRLEKLSFRLGSDRNVGQTWKGGWTSVAAESSLDLALPSSSSTDTTDPTKKWLEYVFLPGRFTVATIETALAVYQTGTVRLKDPANRSRTLVERLCHTIASTATFSRDSKDGPNHEHFYNSTDAQWRQFYRLLTELYNSQAEALSLSIDSLGGIPWVISADCLSAARDCSHVERILHNPCPRQSSLRRVEAVLHTANVFREPGYNQLRTTFQSIVLGELFEEARDFGSTRMRSLYDRCEFSSQITDDDYAHLAERLGGGFKHITAAVFDAILKATITFGIDEKRPHRLLLAEFGKKLVIESIQETLELHQDICLNQLILLIFIEVEVNHGEEGVEFDTGVIFEQLMTTLRRLELLRWMTSHQICCPDRHGQCTTGITLAQSVTVFEGILHHLLGLDTKPGESESTALTQLIIQLCAPDSEYELAASAIQSFLLSQDRPDLALNFTRFTSDDSFSTYIQGRTLLAAGDDLEAAILFKKAAFGLVYSGNKKLPDHNSAGLLDAVDKRLLYAGLPEYYSHIVALYDKEKNYSFVIDFARLALQFVKHNGDKDLDAEIIRAEMHSLLFNATIQTSRWELAYSALCLFTDAALQQSSLGYLLTTMCEANHAAQFVDLPFVGLQDEVDDILAQKCQSIVDITAGVSYHKILYAWRIRWNDFRGAAVIAYETLEKLQRSDMANRTLGKGLETPVTTQYVALINALSCMDPEQAWILTENPPPKSGRDGRNDLTQAIRKVVTLDEVRKGYQCELDRLAAIEHGQFAFAFNGDSEMDAS